MRRTVLTFAILGAACASNEVGPNDAPGIGGATGVDAGQVTTTASVTTGDTATTTGGSEATTVSTSTMTSSTSTTGSVGAGGGMVMDASTTTADTTTSTTGDAGGASSTGGATSTDGMSMGGCDGGPLDAPIPGCEPTPVPDTGDYYADCVTRINQLRWECQCLPPLERWTEGEACADQQAQYDSEQNSAHAGFSDRICDNGGSAQNECPGWGSTSQVVSRCLQGMWDEGPGEPYSEHGHYINMTNPDYGRVACGVYETPGGELWAVQNFSR